MLSKKLEAALNIQINEEYYSSYIYLAMAAYLEDKNLDGCAHWMQMQAREEYEHAMKIFDYMVDRGARVVLTEVKAPPKAWDSPLDAFKGALEHEQYMTGNINKLTDLAIAEKDHATGNLLQWYVTEQVEEEAQVEDIVKKLEMMGTDGPGLFMMDRELKNRPAPAVLTAAAGE